VNDAAVLQAQVAALIRLCDNVTTAALTSCVGWQAPSSLADYATASARSSGQNLATRLVSNDISVVATAAARAVVDRDGVGVTSFGAPGAV
jgi:hypothetical protein